MARMIEWGPGTRVPAMLIAKKLERSGVDHVAHDTTAITKLIEERFCLAPLGERDKAVASLKSALGDKSVGACESASGKNRSKEASAMSETIQLANAAGDSARIALFGAELCAWRSRGVDLIWEIDRRFWDRTAPVLFPIVGATRDGCVRVEGDSYPLSLHGFAWEKDFVVSRAARGFPAP